MSILQLDLDLDTTTVTKRPLYIVTVHDNGTIDKFKFIGFRSAVHIACSVMKKNKPCFIYYQDENGDTRLVFDSTTGG